MLFKAVIAWSKLPKCSSSCFPLFVEFLKSIGVFKLGLATDILHFYNVNCHLDVWSSLCCSFLLRGALLPHKMMTMRQSKEKNMFGRHLAYIIKWMGNDHLKQQMIRKEGIFYLQIGHKLASKLEQVLILLKCHVSTLWTFAGGAFAPKNSC